MISLALLRIATLDLNRAFVDGLSGIYSGVNVYYARSGDKIYSIDARRVKLVDTLKEGETVIGTDLADKPIAYTDGFRRIGESPDKPGQGIRNADLSRELIGVWSGIHISNQGDSVYVDFQKDSKSYLSKVRYSLKTELRAFSSCASRKRQVCAIALGSFGTFARPNSSYSIALMNLETGATKMFDKLAVAEPLIQIEIAMSGDIYLLVGSEPSPAVDTATYGKKSFEGTVLLLNTADGSLRKLRTFTLRKRNRYLATAKGEAMLLTGTDIVSLPR